MKYQFLLLFTLVSCVLFSQKRFLKSFDSPQTIHNPYIVGQDAKTFLNSEAVNQVVNIEAINKDLLAATLYYTINNLRQKRRREPLTTNTILQSLSYEYTQFYSSNSFKRGLNKWVLKNAKTFNFKGTFVQSVSPVVFAIQYKSTSQKYHFDKKEEVFYSGASIEYKRNPDKKKVEIPKHTYLSLANSLIRQMKSTGLITNPAYSEIGCMIEVEMITFEKFKKIPKVKAMIILGGYRLALLKE